MTEIAVVAEKSFSLVCSMTQGDPGWPDCLPGNQDLTAEQPKSNTFICTRQKGHSRNFIYEKVKFK